MHSKEATDLAEGPDLAGHLRLPFGVLEKIPKSCLCMPSETIGQNLPTTLGSTENMWKDSHGESLFCIITKTDKKATGTDKP